MSKVEAILLAAGAASRYRSAGGAEASKLVADYHGEPLARAAAQAALDAGLRVTVVTGHARAEVEAALQGPPFAFAHNPDYATGLASSLKTGVGALSAEAEAALVLLGDMPAVSPEILDRLLAAFASCPGALAAIPLYAGQRGNPVLIGRALFPDIAELTGDEGARRLLRFADPARIVEVEFDDAAVALDIDTPNDLAAATGKGPAAQPR